MPCGWRGRPTSGCSDTPSPAALGYQLPLDQPVGSLVVDVGAGTTEAAVLSLGGVVALEWRRVGGFDLDRDIQGAIERRHGLIVDRATAEQAKLRFLGSPTADDLALQEIRWRNRWPARG